MSDLAIVIPAYKEKYFKETLDSLVRQSNKEFTVYIGDDCSPFDLKSIVDLYTDRLDIRYTRFSDNIGAKNLVGQWRRCIDLVDGNESWLWLFSDDDIADDTCVQDFLAIKDQKAGRFDVYRFNTVTIDATGKVLRDNSGGPDEETSEEMAYHLLLGQRGNSMPDHIFSREVYNRLGFVFTDYAQGADWAISIQFSKEKGICIIPRSKLYWRYSGDNVSSVAPEKKGEMQIGHFQFVRWALKHFEYLKASQSVISYNMIKRALRINVRNVFIHHFKGFEMRNAGPVYSFLRTDLKLSKIESLKELILINESRSAAVNKVYWFLIRLRNVARRFNRLSNI